MKKRREPGRTLHVAKISFLVEGPWCKCYIVQTAGTKRESILCGSIAAAMLDLPGVSDAWREVMVRAVKGIMGHVAEKVAPGEVQRIFTSDEH